MKPLRTEIKVRTALSKTGIPGRKYCLNPYVGCEHACTYCYATFMKRFTGHTEPWGRFVDIKVNTPEVLRRQLKRSEKGTIILSSVTDPYQPLEKKYMITRKCLEILEFFQYPVDILTKSPLVIRDIDILLKLKNVNVGLTITTDDEKARMVFEPQAPPIQTRIEALKKLHKAGIKTYVFIGPLLPMKPEFLVKKIKPYVNSIIIDRMNYAARVKRFYKKYHIEQWLDDEFIDETISQLMKSFSGRDVEVC